MKKIVLITSCAIVVFLGTSLWHSIENSYRRAWKIKAISAIDLVSEKSKDRNCSKEDLKALQDSLTEVLEKSGVREAADTWWSHAVRLLGGRVLVDNA